MELKTGRAISSFVLGATEKFDFSEVCKILMPSILAKTEDVSEEHFLQACKNYYRIWKALIKKY